MYQSELKTYVYKITCIQMFIKAMLIITKIRNNPNTYQLINEYLWFIYGMDNYLAIKINEALIYATKWLNLENIMLWKKPDTKTTHCVMPFICNVQNRQIHRERK